MRATSPLRLAAAVSLMVTVASAAPAKGPLPFVADDAPRALALAKARKLPIFVDAWAPW